MSFWSCFQHDCYIHCPPGLPWLHIFSSLYIFSEETHCGPCERQESGGENSSGFQNIRAGQSRCNSENTVFCFPSSAASTRKSQIHKEPRKRWLHRFLVALNCLSLLPHFWICLYLHNAAWSMIWRCGINESCLELRVSCVFYVCLISRTRCESEQWACGICSVLSGCPPTADRHQRWPGCCRHTGSQTGTSSSKRQRNKTLHSSPAVFVGQNNVKISSSCI